MDALGKWGRIASADPKTAEVIDSKAKAIGSNYSDSMDITGIQERMVEIISNHPEFTAKVMYIFFGDYDEAHGDDSEESPRTRITDGSVADEKASIAKKLLKKFTADEIKGMCRNRYSLMGMQDFLLLLNKLNSASSGKLLQDK
tara:strand:+ start:1032 stop:1463 length:432 start_codon:yes stop_codon:yes gene_type:complete